MNESYWWSLFLKGDKHAFSVIFLAYHDDLFRYGIKLTRDQETVNDCIQNLFLKLWNNRNNLKPVNSVKPYLFRSLRNHIIDTLEIKKETIPLESAIEEFFVIEFTSEDFVISSETEKETHERIIKLLNRLTTKQRDAIYLRYFEDMDFETISGIMNINVQSVRNLISRGLLLMRSLGVIIPFYMILER